MKYDPTAHRAAQKQAIRGSFARDTQHQACITPYLRGIKWGDEHMACNRLPTQALVDTLNHIFALWRTT